MVALVALAVLHAVLNSRLPSPQIQADEGGYLGAARYLASGFGRPGDGYYAGYSLFLVPAGLVTHAASTFYRLVLLTNAGMSVLGPVLALVLMRQLFKDAARWVALTTAGIIAFSPLVFSFAGLAMSENALVPVVLASAVLFARAARDGDLRFVGLASAMAAFAYWVSPRGLVIVLAAVFALVLLAFDTRKVRSVLTTGGTVLAVVLACGQLFERFVNGSGKIAGVSNRKRGLLWAVFHPSAWHAWLGASLGRLSYVGVASAGLTLIGLAVAIHWIVARRDDVDPIVRVRRCAAAFALTATVVTLVADAAALAADPLVSRIDYWYYGRYTEAVAMPVLAIGAGWMLSIAPRLRAARAALLAGLTIAVAAVAVPVLVPHRPPETTINRLTVLGLFAIQDKLGHRTLTHQLIIGAAVALVLGLLISARAWIFGLVAVVALASSALLIDSRYLEPASVARGREKVVADAVRVLGEHGVSTSCITLNHTVAYSYWNEYNYRFQLPRSEFHIVRNNADPPDCGPLVISTYLDYGVARPTARLVTIENDVPMSLWIDLARVSPRVRDDLTRAGLYFPGSPCDRLPDGAYDAVVLASLESGGGHPLDLGSVVVRVQVGHSGHGSPWLGSRAIARADGCGRVQIDATVTDEKGAVAYHNTIGMPQSLLPGEAVDVRAKLAAPGPLPTLDAAHTFTLHIRLVQAGVRYFGTNAPTGVSVAL